MSYSSSSGCTGYEKLSLLDTKYQVQIFRVHIVPNFEVGDHETHNKNEYVYNGFKG